MSAIKNLPLSQAFSLREAIEGSGPIRKVEVADTPGFKIVLFSLDEGQSFPEHAPDGDAMLYILKGRARISINGKTVEPTPGECVAMPGKVTRSLVAVEPLEMLLIRTEGASTEAEGRGCHACGCGH